MGNSAPTQISRALLLAPVIFVCHFLEESPGFVAWFNARVARGITPGLFWRVNLTALIITVAVVGLEWFSRSPFSLTLAMAWLTFLMFANALLHLAGALVDRQYVPGLITALLMYVPYYFWLLVKTVKSERVQSPLLLIAVLLGAIPMLVHGYLIVFRGSRLF